ncbi:galactose-1-phosphate uridyl transferase [Calocera cornea HHB12733]|uniref:Galactose-1-phosphate uridylyltransferase n=1 Tax=Calocera cornea HHB12733 TaxID=1353952 RepID=A0A165ECX9_9BASI|nr:galactose-1-phosphate uridyl transferase [Calocera cornea HHB12733]
MADPSTVPAPEFDPTEHPHRRYNPLLNEHILVSPHRMKRPWQGQVDPPSTQRLPEYDPSCYLCPGNSRSGGERLPKYTATHTFPNDFPAVLAGPAPAAPPAPHPLLTAEPVQGGCDVVIFHPRHDLTLARLSVGEIEQVVVEWTRVYVQRGMQEGNKGAIMGCSNPHPHGQVWSLSSVPQLPATELRNLLQYSLRPSEEPPSGAPRGDRGKPCLLCEYGHFERGSGERVVLEEGPWVALVPWWAVWPYEVMRASIPHSRSPSQAQVKNTVLPTNRHITSLLDLTPDERSSLSRALSRLTKKYDNLFLCSFAYSMGIHQRPTPAALDDEAEAAHLHLHFDPPLLRSASVRKFLVGFELMAEAQRDLTPEQAAKRLRELPERMPPRSGKRSAPLSSDRATRSSKVAKTNASSDVAKSQRNGKVAKGKKAMPSVVFKKAALPLHVSITHTPPTIDVPPSAEPSASHDVGRIADITLLSCDFGTGSYGWKGQKRTVVQLMGGNGDEKEKVQVMFTINAVVVRSKDAEADIVDEPPADVEEAEADLEREDTADEKAEELAKEAAAAA